MILKKCARCGRLMPYGGKWCEACRPAAEKEQQQRKAAAQKRADSKRADRVTAFYRSKEWLLISRAKLQAAGYKCERCGAIAECVHHKHYIRSPGGWERRLEWANLEALCGDCHAIEHGRKHPAKVRGSGPKTPGVVEKV